MYIGIITLYDNGNIGASLQAYALNYVIRSLGHECENIRYIRKVNGKTDSANSFKSRINLLLSKEGRKKFAAKLWGHIILRGKIKKRNKRIHEFSKEKIPQTIKSYYGVEELENEVFNYDCFICGSDNIWQKKRFDPAFFLSFVPDDKTKFSYAAGFSANTLKDEEVRKYIPLIERLDAISVREIFGADTLKKYTNRRIYQHVDPTLLLRREEWDEIRNFGCDVPPRYIFCYILGEESEPRGFAKWLSKKKNIPIVSLPHATSIQGKDFKFADYEKYDAGPAEFLNLVANAAYVITDSFHGCIFSSIYHKQFLAFRRFKNSDSSELDLRLEGLFYSLKMKSRIPVGSDEDAYSLLQEAIDYEKVDYEIDQLKDSSMSYLKRMILKGENNEDNSNYANKAE